MVVESLHFPNDRVDFSPITQVWGTTKARPLCIIFNPLWLGFDL
jgi:hypothetical protein